MWGLFVDICQISGIQGKPLIVAHTPSGYSQTHFKQSKQQQLHCNPRIYTSCGVFFSSCGNPARSEVCGVPEVTKELIEDCVMQHCAIRTEKLKSKKTLLFAARGGGEALSCWILDISPHRSTLFPIKHLRLRNKSALFCFSCSSRSLLNVYCTDAVGAVVYCTCVLFSVNKRSLFLYLFWLQCRCIFSPYFSPDHWRRYICERLKTKHNALSQHARKRVARLRYVLQPSPGPVHWWPFSGGPDPPCSPPTPSERPPCSQPRQKRAINVQQQNHKDFHTFSGRCWEHQNLKINSSHSRAELKIDTESFVVVPISVPSHTMCGRTSGTIHSPLNN